MNIGKVNYLLWILGWIICTPLFAADIKGSHDHPMISRYEGSTIVRYHQSDFDEFFLLNGKVTGRPEHTGKIEPAIRLEGKVTRISYELPAGLSTLAVLRNYEEGLQQAGFEEIFSCANEECGGRSFNHSVVPYDWLGFSENYEDQRYVAAKLTRAKGDVYVAVYVVRNYSAGGPTHNRIYTQVDVVELKPMQSGMIKVDADAMAKEIDETGRIALYGIYFDTDKANIKPESQQTLEEIAQLLGKRSDLKLVIVGHTDNQGSLEYNMDLSNRRAQSVRDALVKNYGVQAARLSAWGAGYLAPVASNKTEEGRAKNRRVELVEQ